MSTVPPILELGKKDEGRLVSSEDFADSVFDEPWRYEREDGRLIVMAPAGDEHIDASEPWRDQLVYYKRDHPEIVQKVVSEAWIRVNDGTGRIGDGGVYLVPNGPVSKIPDRVPDLMFEVVSPDNASRERDYARKRAEYHRPGVRDYIIIDRFEKIVTVLSFAPAGYLERTLAGDQSYESPPLPGFSIRVSDVL